MEPKSFRLVTNLLLLSKLIEQAVIDQLNEHFAINNSNEPLKSGYKSQHSTETALIKIVNDMLRALDDGNVVMVALLDLSAAFDVVDHGILLSRMKNFQGIDGAVLNWLTSYLKEHSQQVTVNGHVSRSNDLDCSFPQGSKFGPQAYKKYTEPLGTLACLLIIAFHFYADVSQLWKIEKLKMPKRGICKPEPIATTNIPFS